MGDRRSNFTWIGKSKPARLLKYVCPYVCSSSISPCFRVAGENISGSQYRTYSPRYDHCQYNLKVNGYSFRGKRLCHLYFCFPSKWRSTLKGEKCFLLEANLSFKSRPFFHQGSKQEVPKTNPYIINDFIRNIDTVNNF